MIETIHQCLSYTLYPHHVNHSTKYVAMIKSVHQRITSSCLYIMSITPPNLLPWQTQLLGVPLWFRTASVIQSHFSGSVFLPKLTIPSIVLQYGVCSLNPYEHSDVEDTWILRICLLSRLSPVLRQHIMLSTLQSNVC